MGWMATSRHAPRPGWGAAAFGNSLPKVTEISSLEPFPIPEPTRCLCRPGTSPVPLAVVPASLLSYRGSWSPAPSRSLACGRQGRGLHLWAALGCGSACTTPPSDFQAGTLGP